MHEAKNEGSAPPIGTLLIGSRQPPDRAPCGRSSAITAQEPLEELLFAVYDMQPATVSVIIYTPPPTGPPAMGVAS